MSALLATQNLETALKLAAEGYSIFPCHSGGEQAKKPMPFIKWREVSTTDAGKIRQWWARWPEAAIGMDLAKCGFIVIDCDRHGENDGVEEFGNLSVFHTHDIDSSPLVATPKEGTHIYFKQPEGCQYGNSKGNLPKGVDVRGAGGYVIAPGTVMADGKVYELFGCLEKTPPLPEWLAEIIRNHTPEKTLEIKPVQKSLYGDERIDAYCEAAISAEISRVESAPKGARNNTLNEAAFALGQLVGAEWKTEAEISALLLNAALSSGLSQSEAIKTINSGIKAGEKEPRKMPDDDYAEVSEETLREWERIARVIYENWFKNHGPKQIIETSDGTLIDADTGKVIFVTPSISNDDRECPIEWLNPPGLVGKIADWIESTSPKPIRLFAVAASLATVGALVARRVYCGIPRSGTNLYMMMILGTSGGKDRPQEAIKQILDAVYIGKTLHKSAAASSASLGVRLIETPAQIQIIDEISKILRKMNNSRGSSNQELSLLEDYCTLWGRNLGTFTPDSTTTRSDRSIKQPWFSIFGATTFMSFHENMKSKHIANGFFNRFLILPKYQRQSFNKNIQPEENIPDNILNDCKALVKFQDIAPSNIPSERYLPPTIDILNAETPPPIYVVPISAEAEKLLNECRQRDEDMLQKADNDPLLEIYGRSSEMIKRIALIICCGRYAAKWMDGACIEVEDITFARRLVDWSMETFVRDLRENLAENEFQANMKFVLGLLRKSRQMSGTDLSRKIDGRIRPRELNEIIEYLENSGNILITTGEGSSKGGRKPKTYKYISG